jgi:APA family basic amino acid/polyamine antiporter
MTGFVAALIACFVPLEALANLISLGTLMVFTFVDAGVILLRLANTAETSHDKVKNQKRVIALVLVYTLSILGTSLVLSNNLSPSTLPLAVFLTIALVCGILICSTPASWRRKQQDCTPQSPASQSPSINAHFECPCFPIIPLGGVAMNTLLMGGLPLSSWLLCAGWLACGLSLYFAYGIHHSKIKNEKSTSHSSDMDRLLKDSKDYLSVGQ